MTKPTYTINPDSVKTDMNAMWSMVQRGLKAGAVVVTLGRPTRTAEQNRKMWPMLTDVSSQVVWHGQKLRQKEWKCVISAALDGQKCVPGIDGGLVFIGASTSEMSKKKFCNMIEAIYAFGAQEGVAWSEPAMKAYQQYEQEQ